MSRFGMDAVVGIAGTLAGPSGSSSRWQRLREGSRGSRKVFECFEEEYVEW